MIMSIGLTKLLIRVESSIKDSKHIEDVNSKSFEIHWTLPNPL